MNDADGLCEVCEARLGFFERTSEGLFLCDHCLVVDLEFSAAALHHRAMEALMHGDLDACRRIGAIDEWLARTIDHAVPRELPGRPGQTGA